MISAESLAALFNLSSLHPVTAIVFLASLLIGTFFLRKLALTLGTKALEDAMARGVKSAGIDSKEVADAKRANKAWLDATRAQEGPEEVLQKAHIFSPSRMPAGILFEIGIEIREPMPIRVTLNRQVVLKTLNFEKKAFIIEEVLIREAGFHTIDLALPDGTFVSAPLEITRSL